MLRRKSDSVIGLVGRCQNCLAQSEFSVDIDETVSDYILRRMDAKLSNMLAKHAGELRQTLEVAWRQRADIGVERHAPREASIPPGFDPSSGRDELQALIGRVKFAEGERDAAIKEARRIGDRLNEVLADRTAARDDVGTGVHTAHRELAQEVNAMLSEIHAVARDQTWYGNLPKSEARGRSVTNIFMWLFDSRRPNDEEEVAWHQLQATDPRVKALAGRAVILRERIRAAGGYHQWLWDIVPRETLFDPAYHEAWQNCAQDGPVRFVVIPAYLIDFTVITKPQVFTTW